VLVAATGAAVLKRKRPGIGRNERADKISAARLNGYPL
jgi:hypothetical protein